MVANDSGVLEILNAGVESDTGSTFYPHRNLQQHRTVLLVSATVVFVSVATESHSVR